MEKIYKVKFFHKFGSNLDIINNWYKNETELKRVKTEGYSPLITLTDGEYEISFKYTHIYEYKRQEHDDVVFYTPAMSAFFRCKIADYVDGAEFATKPVKKEKEDEVKKLTNDEKDAINNEAKAISQFLGLPALIGTQKQKDWATSIRNEKLKNLTDYEIKVLLSNKATKSAKFWIENRHSKYDLLLKEASK